MKLKNLIIKLLEAEVDYLLFEEKVKESGNYKTPYYGDGEVIWKCSTWIEEREGLGKAASELPDQVPEHLEPARAWIVPPDAVARQLFLCRLNRHRDATFAARIVLPTFPP